MKLNNFFWVSIVWRRSLSDSPGEGDSWEHFEHSLILWRFLNKTIFMKQQTLIVASSWQFFFLYSPEFLCWLLKSYTQPLRMLEQREQQVFWVLLELEGRFLYNTHTQRKKKHTACFIWLTFLLFLSQARQPESQKERARKSQWNVKDKNVLVSLVVQVKGDSLTLELN